jgi:hypothetical protein
MSTEARSAKVDQPWQTRHCRNLNERRLASHAKDVHRSAQREGRLFQKLLHRELMRANS